MPSIINSDDGVVSGTSGLKSTGGNDGITTFQQNGTERMRIDSSGNVGIGVTPSAWNTYKAVQLPGASFSGYSDGGGNNQAQVMANAIYDGAFKYVSTDEASRYVQVDGTHIWASAASGTAGNAITFTQVLAVNKGKTLALEGATSQSGTGITFPATQSASSDANTLDDYEQGTFDATITPVVSGTITLNSAYNRMAYTKIGRQVTITGLIIVSSVSSPVGTSVAIGNLPFPCSNIGELASRSSGAVTYRDDSASTYTVIPNQMVETLSQINCYMTAANIAANDEFVVGFTYFADD